MKFAISRRFAGRTVVITGASRGIGKEIALKLAKDGANIVVAAKTTEAHPKLPGTIYSAVEDIEKAGGKGLACVVDVRDEQSVTKAISEAIQKFGGIDILINNASAISLTGTLQTTMKKFDLMHQINTRGTFLMSQKCIPFLKNGKNPHILNISPPLNMAKQWFANHVAYTMAKYGMSMCVLGMHEELRPFNIAVNALWPRTAIWTAAMEMISAGSARNNCRKPTIMADAAYAVLSRDSTNYTGNFVIDEEILREEGIQDFDQYSINPGATLLEDFFLSDVAEIGSPETATSILSVDAMINEVKQRITPDIVQKIQAIYQFDVVEGAKIHSVYFNLKNGQAGIHKTLNNTKDVDVRFITDPQTLCKLFNGKISPTVAVASEKFKIEGNMEKALLLSQLFKSSNKNKL
ncbi:hydroxysteroid dehydrogenase-like protein 2 family protein [Onchocerca flexuosa]|uniref:Hydroxysteroid dehydrogenase-like protein 2 n=1 Tax=Onchocerca flexuosa TaxID=387005 RepID=A0A238BM76_9BILA|nr:hydroxysteroid dehydrogenase-like protein 2 family protein [Onchocerca flexuosa]